MKRERLIELRKSNTIQHAADKIGITRQMLGAVENGTRTPSLPIAFKIARHYRVTLEKIFGGEFK